MVTPEIYRTVLEKYEQRRLAAVSQAESRNFALRAENPEIAEIDRELTGTGLALFRTACAGEDITPLRERNQALCKKRTEILLSMGLPADYTEPQYTCKICSDTGFVETKMCRCFKEALVRENIRTSGMGDLLEKQTFENFDVTYFRAHSEEAYANARRCLELAKTYAENFGKAPENLLFYGTTGTGKTHLTTAIANVVIRKGYSVLYDSAASVVSAFENDHFRSGYKAGENDGDKYYECDLLIIDDLGAEFRSQFTTSALFNLVNTRINKGLSTIISTNLTATQISELYQDRICSRFAGNYKMCQFVGYDHRVHKI